MEWWIGAACITGGHAPSGKRPGDVKSLLFLVPPDANAKGGMHYGAERSTCTAHHHWWDRVYYFSDHMGNLQGDSRQ